MQVDTDLTILAGLTSLLGANQATSASGTAVPAVTGFGPAALLSVGQTPAANATGDLYTHLAGLTLTARTPQAQTVSPQQLKQEQEALKQATKLRLNGRLNEARGVIDGVLAKNPSNAVAVHALGAVELDGGDYKQAEKYFQQAHYLAPEHGFDRDAANARILQHDDEYVLEQARRLTGHRDTRGDGIRLLVALKTRSLSNAEARTLLAENLILEGDATNGLLQYQLAISSANRGQLQQIEVKLIGLVNTAPRVPYVQNLLGQTLLRLGKHGQAAEHLGLAVQLDGTAAAYKSDLARAQVALGRDALQRRDVTTAMGFFRAAQGLDPSGEEVKTGLAEGYLARAEWRVRMGDLSRAIDDFISARDELGSIENEELKSEIAAGLYRVGRRLENRRLSAGEKVGDEITAFQAAYDLQSDNSVYRRKLAETHHVLGDEYLAEDNLRDAAYSYQSAYELESLNETYESDALTTWLAYGDERAAIYDRHEAIVAYRYAYEIDKNNETTKSKLAEAYNDRGLWYRDLGTDYYDEARNDFYEAVKLYPNNTEYQDNYDSVN